MSRRFIWKKFVLPLGIVLMLSLSMFFILYFRADDKGKAGLEGEAGKAMLQVIAAALIGNIVLVIVRDYEDRRKGWLAKRDLLRADLTVGLQELYSRTKAARRVGRTGVTAATSRIDREKYDKLFQEISDIQLGLERYKHEALSWVQLGLLNKSLPDELRAMEKYLGKLVDECEGSFQSSEGSIPLTTVPRLKDFIGPYAGSNFRSEFIHSYRRVVHAVAEQIHKDLRG